MTNCKIHAKYMRNDSSESYSWNRKMLQNFDGAEHSHVKKNCTCNSNHCTVSRDKQEILKQFQFNPLAWYESWTENFFCHTTESVIRHSTTMGVRSKVVLTRCPTPTVSLGVTANPHTELRANRVSCPSSCQPRQPTRASVWQLRRETGRRGSRQR